MAGYVISRGTDVQTDIDQLTINELVHTGYEFNKIAYKSGRCGGE